MKPSRPASPPACPPASTATRRLAAVLGLLALSAANTGAAGAAGVAGAAAAQHLHTRALAATCAQCHGTDGQAVAGQAMVRLAGQPKDYLLAQLLAFRAGQRPATVMHQISRGYSAEQLDEVAAYFAAQK